MARFTARLEGESASIGEDVDISNFSIFAISIAFIGSVTLVAVLAFALAYSILSRRVTHKLERALSDLERLKDSRQKGTSSLSLAQSSSPSVPPMRIHLEFAEDDLSLFGSRGAMAQRWHDNNQFRLLGQFVIEEMGDELIRAFVHEALPVLAAIRFPPDEALPYAEFSILMDDAELIGVSNPPKSTLQLPDGAPGEFFFEDLSIDLYDRMWLRTQELLQAHLPNRSRKIAQGSLNSLSRLMRLRWTIGCSVAA